MEFRRIEREESEFGREGFVLTGFAPEDLDLTGLRMAKGGELSWLVPFYETEAGDIFYDMTDLQTPDWDRILKSKNRMMDLMMMLCRLTEEARRFLLNPSQFLKQWGYVYEQSGRLRLLLVPIRMEDTAGQDLMERLSELLNLAERICNGQRWFERLRELVRKNREMNSRDLLQLFYEIRYAKEETRRTESVTEVLCWAEEPEEYDEEEPYIVEERSFFQRMKESVRERFFGDNREGVRAT
ncbi:MAG: hypothetical protein K5897_08030 [Eubacterium sp.]|nr:hypothetical protein [Eubacterium sp.]